MVGDFDLSVTRKGSRRMLIFLVVAQAFQRPRCYALSVRPTPTDIPKVWHCTTPFFRRNAFLLGSSRTSSKVVEFFGGKEAMCIYSLQ